MLEFITLSRLTGDPTFEEVARRAFFAVWNRRSDIGLIGNTIDVRTGLWMHAVAGVGAGIDSFYECVAARPAFPLLALLTCSPVFATLDTPPRLTF